MEGEGGGREDMGEGGERGLKVDVAGGGVGWAVVVPVVSVAEVVDVVEVVELEGWEREEDFFFPRWEEEGRVGREGREGR